MNTNLSYTNVLELLLFVIFIVFIFSWINSLYVCNVSYNFFDLNTSELLNISPNYSMQYFYSRGDTIYLIDLNKDVSNYNTLITCNWKFLLKK